MSALRKTLVIALFVLVSTVLCLALVGPVTRGLLLGQQYSRLPDATLDAVFDQSFFLPVWVISLALSTSLTASALLVISLLIGRLRLAAEGSLFTDKLTKREAVLLLVACGLVMTVFVSVRRSGHQEQYQYIRLPNGQLGKFRADQPDSEIRALIEKDFPGAFSKAEPQPKSPAEQLKGTRD